jgi:hypothetical protein
VTCNTTTCEGYPILEALVKTTLYGIQRMIKREVEEFGRIEATANRDKYRLTAITPHRYRRSRPRRPNCRSVELRLARTSKMRTTLTPGSTHGRRLDSSVQPIRAEPTPHLTEAPPQTPHAPRLALLVILQPRSCVPAMAGLFGSCGMNSDHLRNR